MTKRLAQWLLLPLQEEAKCIALAAYSCRDSLGFRWRTTLTAFPIKPFRGTDAIMPPCSDRTGQRRRSIPVRIVRQSSGELGDGGSIVPLDCCDPEAPFGAMRVLDQEAAVPHALCGDATLMACRIKGSR